MKEIILNMDSQIIDSFKTEAQTLGISVDELFVRVWDVYQKRLLSFLRTAETDCFLDGR